MTLDEAKKVFINRGFINGLFDGDKWRESVRVISSWLAQEPCEDVVSRKNVRSMITGGKYPNENDEQFIDRLVEGLEKMPPVTPQESAIEIKTVENAEEAEEYQISEDISKGFEEFTKMMFKQGQAENEVKE